MDFDFELLFFYILLILGCVVLFDAIFFARQRKKLKTKLPVIVDYARSFFPMLLLVFSVRSFAYEPRYIPSGSLEPTLLVGDLILVNKYQYGFRLPVSHTKIMAMNEPQRGDIVVFRHPQKSMDLVKRVIGIPGDHIRYIDKVLYINEQKIPQQFEKMSIDRDGDASWEVSQSHENLLGVRHDIYQIPQRSRDDFDVVIPAGKYFMMGDNRDDSADSRSWGFMPEKNIIGKADYVIGSWNNQRHSVRWDRIAKKIV